MSNGAFVISKYETSEGNVVPIKLQPETITATIGGTANAAPAGAVEAGFPSADVSRSKRAIGIHARTVTARITAPSGDYLENTTVRIPILTQSVWDGATRGAAVVCAAGTGVVAGKSAEVIV